MKKKVLPQRTCLGCGKIADQNLFVRICYQNGDLIISPDHHKEGRGGYLCFKEACLQRAIKRKAFNYRLKQKIPPQKISEFTTVFLKFVEKK